MKLFVEQNFDKLIVGFIGETLRGKGRKFDKSVTICQICECQTFVLYSKLYIST